jgi:hypothetical protein
MNAFRQLNTGQGVCRIALRRTCVYVRTYVGVNWLDCFVLHHEGCELYNSNAAIEGHHGHTIKVHSGPRGIPSRLHFLRNGGMVLLEFSRCLRKADNNGIDSTRYNTQHKTRHDHPYQESSSAIIPKYTNNAI